MYTCSCDQSSFQPTLPSARSSKDIDGYAALFVQHRRILPSRVPSLRDLKKVRDR